MCSKKLQKKYFALLCRETWAKKADRHWKAGRSAMEEARAWFPQPKVPEELSTLFASCTQTQNLIVETVIPEKVTRIDGFRGEQRNHDLVIEGMIGDKKAVVCIEAKADESFGKIAGPYADSARQKNARSKVPDRLDLMCKKLFEALSPEVHEIRYQLLTGAAGTLAETIEQKADLAIFVVHEFIGATDPDKVKVNSDDLNCFVRLLTQGEMPSTRLG
ncbi:MAG: hypothetical protein R6V56_03810 [Lentisphaeria bacterium]